MNVEAIRRAFQRRPFVPLELWLDSGEKVRVATPEVWITDIWIGATAADGQPLLLAPESISAIKVAKRNGGNTGSKP